MGDITALMKGRNKELVEMSRKVVVEEEGINLSITENGKEGKRKMIASCRQLQCCGCGWLAPRYQVDPGNEAAVQRGFPRGGHQRRRRRMDLKKWVRCELPSTRTILCSSGEDRRWWMRTGTPFVRPFTKGIEGQAWEALYCHYKELHQAAGATKPGVKRQRPSGQ